MKTSLYFFLSGLLLTQKVFGTQSDNKPPLKQPTIPRLSGTTASLLPKTNPYSFDFFYRKHTPQCESHMKNLLIMRFENTLKKLKQENVTTPSPVVEGRINRLEQACLRLQESSPTDFLPTVRKIIEENKERIGQKKTVLKQKIPVKKDR